MKKTLIALSVLMAAGAQAGTTIYSTDATDVQMKGEIDAVYSKTDNDTTGDEEDGSIYSWAQIQMDVSTKVSDSLTVIGSFEFEATNGEELVMDDTYVGFQGDFGTVKFGETGSSYAILEKAELTNEGADIDVVYSDAEGDGKAARYETSIDIVDLTANYSFTDGDNDNEFAIGADVNFDMVTVGVAYLNGGDDDSGDTIDAMGISAALELDALYVAATYTDYSNQSEINISGGDDSTELPTHDGSTMALSASYSFGATGVYASYQVIDADDADAELTNYYIGASYDVTADIYTFIEYNAAELTGDDVTKADFDGIYAGVYYAF